MAIEVGDEAGIDFRLVDLGAASDLKSLRWLDRYDLRERELAIRRGRLWVPRILSIRDHFPDVPAGEDPAYRLCLDNPGQISGLQMKTCEPAPLGPGMVEIDVKAAALNFRDVMATLGLLPPSAYEHSALGQEVGIEASGVVRRLGEGTDYCGVGDEVIFTRGGCIANRMTLEKHFLFAKPARLSMEEAASTLSVYVTAYYSLIHLARLGKGQRVLIHSAMGGVGQAAIALARHVGAEIYATAGNADKREQLLAMGARGAFDSHSYAWYDDLMTATGGEGVDVVLNSLAGRHIELCLRALRPGGWHCEIGKIDIYADSDLGLRIFRKNLRFAAIDVDRLMIDDPQLTRELSEACMELLGRGALPPLPVTVFPYRDYARALRLMTTGKHQGKLAPGQAGAQGAAGPRRSRLSGRGRPATLRSGRHLPGDRRAGRLRAPPDPVPGRVRRAASHAVGPRSPASPGRRMDPAIECARLHGRRSRDRHRLRRRGGGDRRATLHPAAQAAAQGRVPPRRRTG